MNIALVNTNKYFFRNSVAFYFGYAYFAVEKLIVSLKNRF